MHSDLPGTDSTARVEALLREAHLYRMREDWARAEDATRRVLELAPHDAMARELLGDLQMERGDLSAALESFREAAAHAPGKVSLEEKIARTVLLIAEDERERLAMEFALANPSSRSEKRRNSTVAVLLSVLCPGAGQLFHGDTVKGIGILVAGLSGLFLGAGELFKLALQLSGSRLPTGETVNQGLAVLGIIGIMAWLYGLLDSSAGSARRSAMLDI